MGFKGVNITWACFRDVKSNRQTKQTQKADQGFYCLQIV